MAICIRQRARERFRLMPYDEFVVGYELVVTIGLLT